MRTERLRGLASAGGFVGLVVFAAACMGKPDWPPFVPSGNPGGNGGGGSSPATTPMDAGAEEDAAVSPDAGAVLESSQSCPSIGAQECEEVISTAGDLTCPGVIGTTCPTAGITGCCEFSSGSDTIQLCFYTGSTDVRATMAGCAAIPGTYGTAPAF